MGATCHSRWPSPELEATYFPGDEWGTSRNKQLAEIEVASAQAMSVILAWDINNGDDISKLVAAEAPWQAFRFRRPIGRRSIEARTGGQRHQQDAQHAVTITSRAA